MTNTITTLEEAIIAISELQAQVAELQAKVSSSNRSSPSSRTMNDDDARRVLGGDLADEKHKDAAEKLGLSYGQIYSARLGFTFKSVAAKLKAEGVKNRWIS